MAGLGDLHIDDAADCLDKLMIHLEVEHADLVLDGVPAVCEPDGAA